MLPTRATCNWRSECQIASSFQNGRFWPLTSEEYHVFIVANEPKICHYRWFHEKCVVGDLFVVFAVLWVGRSRQIEVIWCAVHGGSMAVQWIHGAVVYLVFRVLSKQSDTLCQFIIVGCVSTLRNFTHKSFVWLKSWKLRMFVLSWL